MEMKKKEVCNPMRGELAQLNTGKIPESGLGNTAAALQIRFIQFKSPKRRKSPSCPSQRVASLSSDLLTRHSPVPGLLLTDVSCTARSGTASEASERWFILAQTENTLGIHSFNLLPQNYGSYVRSVR